MSRAALTGRTFGSLTVLAQAEKRAANGAVCWRCRCDCGREIVVAGTLLTTGRKQHCGCKTQRKPTHKDIAGQKFNRLTALYALAGQRGLRSALWHCRCDCGREVDVLYNDLVYSARQSCGCQKREHDGQMPQMITRVAGTSVDMLRSTKIPKNNTTGARGVYLIRGKYVARIVFQKKAYDLGAYARFEDALEARREAEEILNEGTVRHYERWKARAQRDPQWAEKNPIDIRVRRGADGRIAADFLPEMGEEEL